MDSKNKILFAYPVKFKDGMQKNEMIIPNPFFTDLELGALCKVIIVVGTVLTTLSPSFFSISIFHENESEPLPDDDADGEFQNLKIGVFEDDELVMLTAFIVHDLQVSTSGIHNVLIKLFKADEDGNRTQEIDDTYTCQMFVKVNGEK